MTEIWLKILIKVKLADAEVQASSKYVAAAEKFKNNETALQLRYLEALNTISGKFSNSTNQNSAISADQWNREHEFENLIQIKIIRQSSFHYNMI